MSYNDDEISRSKGAPRELYRFVGTYSNYYYTSGPKKVTWKAPDEDEAQTYIPFTLERSEVNAGTPDDDNLDLTIDLPVTAEVVLAYAFNTSPPDLNLTIWRYHRLTEVVPYWRGRITNISIDEGIATLTSPSELGSAMAQPLPNVFYQAPCNHVLYDRRCKVLESNWTKETTITNVVGKTVTLASIGHLNNSLVGGELALASGERRMIVSQIGNTVTVNFPFAEASIGDDAFVAAGCDYAYEGDCKTKFSNQLNFGGFPFMPETNIFKDGIEDGSKLEDTTCKITEIVWLKLRFAVLRPGTSYGFGANWSVPPFKPNPPNGRLVDTFGGGPPNFNLLEYVNGNDPDLHGQRLVSMTGTLFDFTVSFHYPIPAGHFTAQMQWSTFTFDPNDNTNKMNIFRTRPGQGTSKVLEAPVGNGVRFYEWDA